MNTTTTPAKRRISPDDALALWREYKATGASRSATGSS